MMDANFILTALRAHHSGAAIVEEVVISDHLWDERTAENAPARRIDALMFEGLQRTAIEVKVSLADWKRDHYRKRAPWMAVTHRFVYAVPADLYETVANRGGLLDLDVWNCGIWTVDNAGRVKAVRKAQVRPAPEPLPQHVVQALAYRAAKTGVADQSNRSVERCTKCGGLNGSHHLVHTRHGNGGGSNKPCPNQSIGADCGGVLEMPDGGLSAYVTSEMQARQDAARERIRERNRRIRENADQSIGGGE